MRILENMLSPQDPPITLVFSEHDTARADPYCPAVTHPTGVRCRVIFSRVMNHVEVFVTRLIRHISSHGLQTLSNSRSRCGERSKGGFTKMPVKADNVA